MISYFSQPPTHLGLLKISELNIGLYGESMVWGIVPKYLIENDNVSFWIRTIDD